MRSFTSFALLVPASAVLAFQLAFLLRPQVGRGAEHACPAEGFAAPATRNLEDIITHFEEWKGTTCTPRLERPLRRGRHIGGVIAEAA